MLDKFLSKDGADLIRFLIKFFGRSTIYMVVVFVIMTLCTLYIAAPYGVLAGASICVGLLIAVLFHLYERG